MSCLEERRMRKGLQTRGYVSYLYRIMRGTDGFSLIYEDIIGTLTDSLNPHPRLTANFRQRDRHDHQIVPHG